MTGIRVFWQLIVESVREFLWKIDGSAKIVAELRNENKRLEAENKSLKEENTWLNRQEDSIRRYCDKEWLIHRTLQNEYDELCRECRVLRLACGQMLGLNEDARKVQLSNLV